MGRNIKGGATARRLLQIPLLRPTPRRVEAVLPQPSERPSPPRPPRGGKLIRTADQPTTLLRRTSSIRSPPEWLADLNKRVSRRVAPPPSMPENIAAAGCRARAHASRPTIVQVHAIAGSSDGAANPDTVCIHL